MPVITKPNQHFDAVTWTGTNSSAGRSVTGVGFQPDFVWAKRRSASADNLLYDAVRGAGANKELTANLTNAEGGNNPDTYDYLSSFNSDGFSSTWSGSNNAYYFNELNATYVAWCFKAGGTAVTNTSGSITSQVSVNTTAGFSIVSYASGSAGEKTVGHGLGVTPSMIITKSRDNSSYNWSIYHSSVIDTTSKFLRFTTDGIVSSSTIWGAALPNTTVFGITSDNGVPANNNCIAYCFAQVAGYSAISSYTGNNSNDGPFIYTGFRPRFVLVKRTDTTANWTIRDSARRTYNANGLGLFPNLSNAEDSTSGRDLDLLSNGFKIRGTDTDINASGGTYIYMAFAEAPFKYANAR